jgi:hypothetical protein
MTDTGSFRYSNTDSHAHRMAADLLSHGLDPQKIHAQVHSHASAGRLRFFGEVLSKLELLENGRLVVMEASPEQFQVHGLSGSDTEGLVDMPRSIAGVDVVALFSEVEPGKVKGRCARPGASRSTRCARVSAAADTRTPRACCCAARGPRRGRACCPISHSGWRRRLDPARTAHRAAPARVPASASRSRCAALAAPLALTLEATASPSYGRGAGSIR